MYLSELAPQLRERGHFSLSELAKTLHVDVSTCWRWTLRGVGGERLRSFKVGGRRRVRWVDVNEFLARLNGRTAQPVSTGQDRPAAVEAELESLGL